MVPWNMVVILKCKLDLQALQKCSCDKEAFYEPSRAGMVGGSALTKYHQKDITRIISHIYGEESKLEKNIADYDTR